jgi:hypothetical protein
MNSVVAQAPITSRLDERIEHFDKLAGTYRNLYMFLRTVQILSAASIPVVALWKRQYTSAILGALVIVIETWLQTFQVQQYWIKWRGNQRRLLYEKQLYANHAGLYKPLSQDDATALLSERVEDYLLNEEYPDWRELTETLGKQGKERSK